MLYCILHKKLQHGRGKVSFAFFQFEADVRDDPPTWRTIEYKYALKDFISSLTGIRFGSRLSDDVCGTLSTVTQNCRPSWYLLYQFQQVVEIDEHEVRINLQLQRVELRL